MTPEQVKKLLEQYEVVTTKNGATFLRKRKEEPPCKPS